jgi:hypothetical protein
MSSKSAKCARQSQIARNVENGVYLRKALNKLDGKFTTKRGSVRRVKAEMQEKYDWDKFFGRR